MRSLARQIGKLSINKDSDICYLYVISIIEQYKIGFPR